LVHSPSSSSTRGKLPGGLDQRRLKVFQLHVHHAELGLERRRPDQLGAGSFELHPLPAESDLAGLKLDATRPGFCYDPLLHIARQVELDAHQDGHHTGDDDDQSE
jgi:hypothetical protein